MNPRSSQTLLTDTYWTSVLPQSASLLWDILCAAQEHGPSGSLDGLLASLVGNTSASALLEQDGWDTDMYAFEPNRDRAEKLKQTVMPALQDRVGRELNTCRDLVYAFETLGLLEPGDPPRPALLAIAPDLMLDLPAEEQNRLQQRRNEQLYSSARSRVIKEFVGSELRADLVGPLHRIADITGLSLPDLRGAVRLLVSDQPARLVEGLAPSVPTFRLMAANTHEPVCVDDVAESTAVRLELNWESWLAEGRYVSEHDLDLLLLLGWVSHNAADAYRQWRHRLGEPSFS